VSVRSISNPVKVISRHYQWPLSPAHCLQSSIKHVPDIIIFPSPSLPTCKIFFHKKSLGKAPFFWFFFSSPLPPSSRPVPCFSGLFRKALVDSVGGRSPVLVLFFSSLSPLPPSFQSPRAGTGTQGGTGPQSRDWSPKAGTGPPGTGPPRASTPKRRGPQVPIPEVGTVPQGTGIPMQGLVTRDTQFAFGSLRIFATRATFSASWRCLYPGQRNR